jgi:D-arabinose 1-dehydrogenase-like Zn-dependent alcohol dehydrogenase
MKALLIHSTPRGKVTVENVTDPKCTDNGVILKVAANGICRSDWHEWNGDWGWIGLVPYKFPITPGHEGSGTIVEIGKNVKKWKVGDRVISGVCFGCGVCSRCKITLQHNMCEKLRVIGFHIDGLFAEYCHAPDADFPGNLIKVPDAMDLVTASAFGCRFQTAYHGMITQGRIKPGDKVAVWGQGGIGLVATHVAAAMGCYVVAIDINDKKLEFAKKVGAHDVVNAKKTNAVQAVKDLTSGGANVSVDAVGIAETMVNSILCLTNKGRHVQIGLSTREEQGQVSVPIDLITALELEIHGSMTMPFPQYDQMINDVLNGRLQPAKLIGKMVKLEDTPAILRSMTDFKTVGRYTVLL